MKEMQLTPEKIREMFREFDKHNYAERLLNGEELYIHNSQIPFLKLYAKENELDVGVLPAI